MRLTALATAALMAWPLTAAAERVVTPQEFEQMVHGKTFYFDRYGEPFGSEQYFTDKRVIWAFEGGQCQRGIWFANAEGNICFVYDSDPAPQCWHFIEMPGGGFHARVVGDPPSEDLVTSDVDAEPIDCPLPDLGV
ncbi:hypothetical protein JANAI62_13320 [Jannaschia pagri]|uniref:Beta/Gamma crystallin n=1 Tax=Jannaschia pagri TaxID=2829797 RepID=A0ABQ4NKH9_9RHOB|nr:MULTISPECIES: hypothetical protein [unclassified Jannaschia]GIT90878.1 hypothetical protein JANAI61_13360 [Jannaschia sp. AI_61]GIT94709.1 hypothetical protein JANAI62_13320 [Jannaschia sp. AI_62]